jgi:ATP-binding cassette subfamily B protein
VGFSYPNASEPILKKANISFQRGQVNVIAGRSGAGKSTFINLCMGLRKPQKGAVFYNDKDISAVSEQSLMDAMGLVEQEPFIFDGLIAENIFCDKNPVIGYALELFQKFGLSYLVANENDLYNIKLGKNGRELSVGEKQRLALIRALVKKSEIICFDEVTSNLDRPNALKIIECIQNTAKDKLVICVTHDEILIQQADALYELGDGEILQKK